MQIPGWRGCKSHAHTACCLLLRFRHPLPHLAAAVERSSVAKAPPRRPTRPATHEPISFPSARVYRARNTIMSVELKCELVSWKQDQLQNVPAGSIKCYGNQAAVKWAKNL